VLKPLVINGMTFASAPLTTVSLAGGAGGIGGFDPATGGTAAAGLAGSLGTIDIFGQIVIVDPLSIPEVSQNYNTINDSTNKSTETGSLNPDEQKKKDEDNKKGAAVCK
jgi:hypothetical protein